MYLPLSTQPVALSNFVPPPPLNVIPAGGSRNINFLPLPQSDSGVLREVLKNLVTDPARCSSPANAALSCDVLTLTITKTTAVAAQDTMFVANALGNLTASGPGTIVFPVSLATSDVSKTDSLYLSQSSVTMLQTAAQDGAPLWIQLRGQVSNPGASPVTITSADVIGIKLSATLRVQVSHR